MIRSRKLVEVKTFLVQIVPQNDFFHFNDTGKCYPIIFRVYCVQMRLSFQNFRQELINMRLKICKQTKI